MKRHKQQMSEDRDIAFEVPDLYSQTQKPGFKRAEKKTVSKDEYRFAPAKDKDVPRQPLARRIARTK